MAPKLNNEAQQAYDLVNSWLPAILREQKMQTVDWLIDLMMAKENVSEGTLEMVVTAGRFVNRPSAKVRFDKLLGIEVPRPVAKAPYESLEGYYNAGRTVRRWPPAPGKPEKKPAEMRVLGLSGSSREDGNTEALIDAALRGAADAGAQVEKIRLAEANIQRCENVYMLRDFFSTREIAPEVKMDYCVYSRGMENSERRGTCLLEDDMPAIYEKIAAADAVIIGFPCINGWEGDVLTAFQERWQRYEGCMVKDRIGPGRRGMVIGTWGTNDIQAYDNITENIINKLNMRGFPVAEVISACGFAGMMSGIDEDRKGVIHRYPEELKTASLAGRSLVTGTDTP